MIERDDLNDFIADCEWKTRKILRDANKRRNDSAMLFAAKERVELLKHKGVQNPATPTKTANPSITDKKSISSINNGKSHTSSSPIPWKRRDKIIHNACETIKSLDAAASPKLMSSNAKKELAAQGKRYASLCASPFNDRKGSSSTPSLMKKGAPRTSRASGEKNEEPAVITRRTIERDFYIMSKKRSQPKKRRQKSAKKGDAKPELNSSVLWKKYRCVDRVMEANSREAEKLYEEFERLRPFDGDFADEKADYSDSELSSSSEEEQPNHALVNLLNKHVAEENFRSQRRTEKMLQMQIEFKSDVQAMWDKLEEGNGKIIPRNTNATKQGCQIQSVSFEAATKSFIHPRENVDLTMRQNPTDLRRLDKKAARFSSPYKEPDKILSLICNEPVAMRTIEQLVTVNVSVSFECPPSESESAGRGSWIYDIYKPCDGSLQTYRISDDDFCDFILSCRTKANRSADDIEELNRIVYRQEVGSDYLKLVVVVLCLNKFKITATIHRSKKAHFNVFDIDVNSLDDQFEKVLSLQAAEILQILGKQCIYSPCDTAFWIDNENEDVIWKPLIDIVYKNGSSIVADEDALARSVSACDSLNVLKEVLAETDDGGSEIISNFFSLYHDAPLSRGSQETKPDAAPPLSMRISNHSPYSPSICPGHTITGRQGVWRLTQPIVEDQSNTLFPVWLTDAKYPSHLDRTQATAHLYYRDLGPKKGSCVTTLVRMAFESPVYSPYCYVIDKGYIIPPISQPKLVDGTIPSVELPCKSLLEHPLQSRFDTLLPPTVVVLDPGASEDDWIDAPRDGAGNVYHIRNKDQFNKDGFRIKTYAHKIQYDDTVKSIVYGISEKAATPNSPAAAPFFMHKSIECCTEYLSRKRTASDYHYIAESDGEGTPSVPHLFTTHMKAYKPVHVSRKSITSYRDEDQFAIATKEAEAKKAEIAFKIKAAEEIAEARLQEKMAMIHQSMEQTTMANPTNDMILPSAAAEKSSIADSTASDVESLTHPAENQPNDDVDELDEMANSLLNNTNFLRTIARKLNLPEDNVTPVDSAISKGCNADDEQVPPKKMAEAEAPIFQPTPVPKLDLGRKTYKGDIVIGIKGDGWKRLPRADTLVGEFKLNTRKVEKNRNGEKFDGFQGRRNFFAVNAVEEMRYEADPESYGIKTTTMFVADLATERLRLSKSQRQQRHYEKSLLTEDQKFALQEIRQIPVESSNHRGQDVVEDDYVHGKDEIDDEPEMNRDATDSLDPVTQAILAVKNHNIQHLERVLDTEALSIETRDQHGNTLFILACQQGSKRLAKFLLRRGADINAQNNSGNTALHYLHEYHHRLLADYLERKGADNSIRNAKGLTVYEGVVGWSDE